MRLIDADELKERFRWSEVCRLSISEINKIIDSEPTCEWITVFCEHASTEELRDFRKELEKIINELKEGKNDG